MTLEQQRSNTHSKITKTLTPTLEHRYNQNVDSVTQLSNNRVRVETAQGQIFDADAVVVTLPLGVLKKGVVKFEPSLPLYKQQVINRMGFGALNKVMLKFPEPFFLADYPHEYVVFEREAREF